MSPTGAETVRIGPGEAVAVELEAGEELVVSSPAGGQGGDLSFPGFAQGLTRNAAAWERFGRPWVLLWVEEGARLLDTAGEPVLEVGPNRGPGHIDITYPGCWSGIYDDGRPGCQELVSAALGIGRGELTGMLSFFLAGSVEEGVYKGFSVPAEVAPGDFVSFKALRPTPVAVCACPDDEVPGWTPAPLQLEVRGGA